MKEITFLTESCTKQLEATLAAREMCDPATPLYFSYTPTLMRLTNPIVVQCVEYTMAMAPNANRKELFSTARNMQNRFVTETPVLHTKAPGYEFGLKLANQILQQIIPEQNPLTSVTTTIPLTNSSEGSCETEASTKLRKLFKDLIAAQTQIGEILCANLNNGYVKTA